MNVIHLVSSRKHTGASAVAFSWHDALLRAGHRSLFVYEGGSHLEKQLQGRPDCSVYPGHLGMGPFLRRISDGAAVFAHLSRDRWLCKFLASTYRRLYFVFHSRRSVRADPIHNSLHQRISGALPAFPGMELPHHSPPVPWIPPGIDTELFRSGNQSLSTPVIATIGKLSPERKHSRFLHLLAALKRRGVAFEGRIIGKGPDVPNLRALAGRLEIEDCVTLRGFLEGATLAEELRAVDLMIWCTPGSQESHRALPEAQVSGAVVASFPMDGIEAWIDPGVTGLFLPSNPERAAGVVYEALLNRDHWNAMRQRGQNHAHSVAGYEAVRERISEILSPIFS